MIDKELNVMLAKEVEELIDPLLREVAGRAFDAGLRQGAEIAKSFIPSTPADASPYVNGMADSATRIYQCILACAKGPKPQ